jgi:hypothetical protein
MSLNAREERSLGRIANDLTGSDPQLASMLDVFNRLTSGEMMPAHCAAADNPERDSARHANRLPRCRWIGRVPALSQVFIAGWILITAMMIAVALTLILAHTSGGSRSSRTCGQLFPGNCSELPVPHPADR